MSDQAELPILVLKLKRYVFFSLFLLFVVMALVAFFNITLPVIKTGDFNLVKLNSPSSYDRKVFLFYSVLFYFLIVLPPMFSLILRTGDISFYSECLKVNSFFGLPTQIYYYRDICVTYKKNITSPSIAIRNSEFPPHLILHPLKRFKWRFLHSANIGLTQNALINPEMGQSALNILSKHAAKFIEK